MKAQKGQFESKFVKENANAHIYQSVTPYDEYQDTVEYSVGVGDETVGRFDSLAEANKVFDDKCN